MGPFTTHRFLARLALSSVHIFAWLFVFQYFFIFTGSILASASGVALAYALTQTVAVLLTPLAARRLRNGIRGLLINALLCLAAAFAALAAAFSGILGSIGLGVALFAICMGLYRALYWIPYELAARKHTVSRFMEIALALVPAAAGIYMSSSSFAPLIVLCFASAAALLAIVPIFHIKDTHEGFSWNYRETFHHLFTPAHRIPLIQAMCNGFEGAALLLLWPLVILVLLGWSFGLLGIVLSLTYLCILLGRALLGGAHEQTQTPIIHSVLTLSGWILRGTIVAPLSIIIVDTYYGVGSGVGSRGVDLLTAEQSADSNSYVDEFTALKEMGQGIGRIIFCLMLVTLASIASFPILAIGMFGITGLMPVLSIQLARRSSIPAF